MDTPIVFDEKTPDGVKNVINLYLHNDKRIRVFYGDIVTGKDWGEEWETVGYVGKSTGWKPCALLINNRRSLGGGAISSAIVKIMDVQTKKVLYQHPAYNQPVYTVFEPPSKIGDTDMKKAGYTHGVYADGSNVANFKNEKAAQNYIDFMRGLRMSH